MRLSFTFAALLAVLGLSTASAHAASVYITEFSSNSGDNQKYEFVEFTNTGTTPVDMTGWSEDDSTRTPNKIQHDLSAFGILAPHESAIFTEADPDAFRIYWWGSVAAAPAGLKIIGPYFNDNLSSSGDEINLYDNTGTNVDQLTYNPLTGGLGSGVSRSPGTSAALGVNDNSQWVDSAPGDAFNSFPSIGGIHMYGSPGYYLPPIASLAGDVNNDGVVNAQDIAIIGANWLHTGPSVPGDANHDTVVNAQDIAIVGGNWLHKLNSNGSGSGSGSGAGQAAAVPEPSSSMLAIFAGVAGLWARRRVSAA